MSSDISPPILRLNNLYAHVPVHDLTQMTVKIPKSEYKYLFAHILAGNHGCIQAVLSHLVSAFISQLHAEGIPQIYQEDGPQIVAKILSKINFNERNQPAPDPVIRPTRSRRANPKPAGTDNESDPRDGNTRAASKRRVPVSNDRGDAKQIETDVN